MARVLVERQMAKVLTSRKQRRNGNLYDPDCPSRSVLDHITSRWGSLILLVLLNGTQRFSALVREIGGVSEKMLAQSLKALEMDGFLRRTVYPTIPPRVEYSLTPAGREVATHIKSLTDWVEDNVGKVMKVRSRITGRRDLLRNERSLTPPS